MCNIACDPWEIGSRNGKLICQLKYQRHLWTEPKRRDTGIPIDDQQEILTVDVQLR